MSLSVGGLIGLAEEALEAGGYAARTRLAYRDIWREFECFCLSEGYGDLTRRDEATFLASIGCPAAGGTRQDQFTRRAVSCLFDVAELGVFRRNVGRIRTEAPACFAAVHKAYSDSLAQRGLAAATREGKRGASRRFLAFTASAGVTRIAELRAGDVFAYLSSFADAAASTRAEVLFFLREYLRFLVARFGADRSLGDLFPVILVNKDEVLPSVYSPNEIRRALAALDQTGPCARRDRAVVLLAAQLGLRAGDIRQLRYDQIDWRLSRLSLVQTKTGVRVDLPLPDECRFALLDYLKNSRPVRHDPHVFIRSRAPFGPYCNSETFHRVISSAFERAGVDVAGRHRGLHALRHSAAVAMLATGATLPTVSGVLGHSSQETTRRYLKVGVEELRPLALEVPDAS
jgi:integrase